MFYGPVNYGYNMGWGILMGAFWLIFLCFIILITIRMFRHRDMNWHRNFNDPLDIVKERYAKGEINKEQFEQLKKDLK
jgi:putative membrane protein